MFQPKWTVSDKPSPKLTKKMRTILRYAQHTIGAKLKGNANTELTTPTRNVKENMSVHGVGLTLVRAIDTEHGNVRSERLDS